MSAMSYKQFISDYCFLVYAIAANLKVLFWKAAISNICANMHG